MMKRLNRIIYFFSILLLCFWFAFPLIRLFFGIEFSNSDYKIQYKLFLFIAIPIATILTLFTTIKNTDKKSQIITKVIGTILISAFFGFIISMSVFIDMCAWSNEKNLYLNFRNNNKIILRNFDCGALDSGPPKVEIHKIKYLSKYFIKYSEIDTNLIDKNLWKKIH